MKQRWELIKRLVDAKLEKHKSYAICDELSVSTENKLKEHFKLTFKAGNYIKFERKGEK